MSSYKSKKKKKPSKPPKYPYLYRHPYWKIFMIANPFFLLVMITIMAFEIIPLWAGIALTIVGYIGLWQFVRIARRDVATAAGTNKKSKKKR